jgi:hypothetical protein
MVRNRPAFVRRQEDYVLLPLEEPRGDDPLIGLVIDLQDPCKCGAYVVVIRPGKGPHIAELRCEACDHHRGWLSQQTAGFINKTIEQFGRLTDPIKVRRAA